MTILLLFFTLGIASHLRSKSSPNEATGNSPRLGELIPKDQTQVAGFFTSASTNPCQC